MTKLDAYEGVIERLESRDCLVEAFCEWIEVRGYQKDIFWQLQDLGIVDINIEVDEDKLEKFKETIEYMRELQDELDDYKERDL